MTSTVCEASSREGTRTSASGQGEGAEVSGVFHGVLELLGEGKQIGQRLATARGREEHKLVMTSVGGNGLFLHGIQCFDTKVLKDFLLGHGDVFYRFTNLLLIRIR